VVVARTGNVPEATAHGKLVEQFAATRPEHAADVATTTAATTAATTTATATAALHADPIKIKNELIPQQQRQQQRQQQQKKLCKKQLK
jgi:hypothetical protein